MAKRRMGTAHQHIDMQLVGSPAPYFTASDIVLNL
ncbi:hypothetical protein Fuma_03914 [Fuerstiella marisgermanici]|uniref:Uncharacterized protein n=1 Tax=Fuerstiella marisgermanici TaxID=1891926 RepID=A0A1P8WJQ8_9PLAN|nr:hypothetical protein Fuma_03914 [Fuerstiella marisgermanici]